MRINNNIHIRYATFDEETVFVKQMFSALKVLVKFVNEKQQMTPETF